MLKVSSSQLSNLKASLERQLAYLEDELAGLLSRKSSESSSPHGPVLGSCPLGSDAAAAQKQASSSNSPPPPPRVSSVAVATTASIRDGDVLTVYVGYSDGSQDIRSGGSKAWRNNNPGNIDYGDFAIAHGAIGANGDFAIFPDEATGRAAEIALLKSASYQSQSLAGAIGRWAPPSSNDTDAYITAVSTSIGLPKDTPMNSLNQTQLESLASAIQTHEGWTAGIVSHLPPPK